MNEGSACLKLNFYELRFPCYSEKETMNSREATHTKFASFCTPYYLRHGIEIFSDNSFPLDVTVLFWKLKENEQKAIKMIFEVSHSNRKCAAAVKCLFSLQFGQIKFY